MQGKPHRKLYHSKRRFPLRLVSNVHKISKRKFILMLFLQRPSRIIWRQLECIMKEKLNKFYRTAAKPSVSLEIYQFINSIGFSEKQEQINRLISAQQSKSVNGRCLPIRFESPHKSKVINANASYEYLCNKVKDLDINVKFIMEQFIDSEDQIKSKIQKVQNQFIRYFAEKLGSCQFRLTKFIQKIQRKCSGFQNYILQIERQSTKNGQNIDIDIFNSKLPSQLRQKINQFSQDIRNFQKKQYKYQNERVQSLQNILIGLLAKFGAIQNRYSLRGSRKSNNGYYLQDEDQFFYPSSDRKVYQTNDDYEHFQSESDDDHPSLTKENISDNMQTYLLEKMKKN